MEEITIKLPDYCTYELLLELTEFGMNNAFESKQRSDYAQLKSDILKGVEPKYKN